MAFERFRVWAAQAFLGKQFPLFPQTGETLLQGFFPSTGVVRRGRIELLNAYRALPWLRASTNKIGEEIASTNWKLFVRTVNGRPVRDRALQRMDYDKAFKSIHEGLQDGTLREIEGPHPFLELLDRGSDRLDGWASDHATQVHLDTIGESFWWLQRNNAGLPGGYIVLASHWVKELPKENFPFYEISFGAIHELIPAEDIIWWKHADPANPYGRGTGVGESLGDELDLDESAVKFLKAFFKNDATPPLLIGLKGASETEMNRAMKKWEQRHKGIMKKFRAHFFRGELDVKTLAPVIKDMMMTELRTAARDTTHQVYGIPPEILGIIANSNRATITAAESIFARHVILPRLEFRRRGYQRNLVPLWDDRLIVWYDSPIPDDLEKMLAAAKAMPSALEYNEWRQMQGLDAKPELEGLHPVPGKLTPQVIINEEEEEEEEPEEEEP
ncbi:hypothetical protein LCGC14_2452480, partial [marine sediment metagenome]